MSSSHPHPGDTMESRLAETQVPPPTAETAPQRQSSSYTDKPPEGPAEPYPERNEPAIEPFSSSATYLYTLSYLVFFSIFGTLARLGLQALTFYPGAPVVTGVLWANVGGSLLMGFFLEDKNIFREEWGHPHGNDNTNDTADDSKRHTTIKKTIPLYIGLTTGFCGSFTSFSSFIRDIFLALSNDLPNPSIPSSPSPRNGGYSFMALVAIILTQVSLSIAALISGSHLALALDRFTLPPPIPFRLTRRIIDPLFALLAWGCWLGTIILAIWPPSETWRGRAVFAIVFAPLGCLLRFYLSLVLNARIPSFPLGTFTVNILGTIILAMCFDLQHVDGIGASGAPRAATSSVLVSCQVLQGVMDGFCGSATTVSTWVAELNGLSRRLHAYIYGFMSVGVAWGFFVIIAGSLRWTVGFGTPVCD
ncbi:CrcB-like protein-domain-containing protein [Aspergillus cavernicola]|uniref:CrcB-like protein-domain-containing protein n=1 Tax=Aspergillus cavernicola TaxID=176166 RepID=A0ABR4IN95_9EURO